MPISFRQDTIRQRPPTADAVKARPVYEHPGAYDYENAPRVRPVAPLIAVTPEVPTQPAPKAKAPRQPRVVAVSVPGGPSVADRVVFHLKSGNKYTASEIAALVAADFPDRAAEATIHTAKCQLARVHATGRVVVLREVVEPLDGRKTMRYWCEPG